MAIKLTKDDKKWILDRYPKLKINNETSAIYGNLIFCRNYNGVTIEDNYDIEIKLENGKNSILPKVKETSNKINDLAKTLLKPPRDLHINENGTLCLCISEKESDYFPDGFKFSIFFEQLLEPFFYWISYYKKYNNPPWGEYAHENLGYLELYAENYISIERLTMYFSNEQLYKISRLRGHSNCLCGKKNKLRKCHKLIYQAIYKLKKELH